MYLLESKILIGYSYVICGYIALKCCMLLSNPNNSISGKVSIFFMNISFRNCKKRIFHPKTWIFTKNENFSLEEYVLIELCISIDLIIFFSSFEVIVLLLGVNVMTFVLYPLFMLLEIVKDWNATEPFAFEGVIVWSMPNQLK